MGNADGNVIDFNPYAEATEELDSYFGELDAAMGIRAQRYDGAGGMFDPRVGDIDAALGAPDPSGQPLVDLETRRMVLNDIGRHLDLRTPAHRAAVQKKRLIDATLAGVEAEQRRVLGVIFTPRRFDWTVRDGDGLAIIRPPRPGKVERPDWVGEKRLREAFAYAGSRTVSLLALALETEAARIAYNEHEATKAARAQQDLPLRQVDLLLFLDFEAGRGGAGNKVIAAVKAAAGARAQRALYAYEQCRRARIAALADIRSHEAVRERARARAARLQGVSDD